MNSLELSSFSSPMNNFKTLDHYEKVSGLLTNGQSGTLFQCKYCTHQPFQPGQSINNLSKHTNTHNIFFAKDFNYIPKEKLYSIDRALLLFIIFTFSPFVIITNKYFKQFLYELNPSYKLPDRKTLIKLLNEIYDEYKSYSIDYLKNIIWIHSTCDNWTSCANSNYLGITVHFVDALFQMKSLTLSLRHYLGSHTGVNLKACMVDVFEEFEVKSKIVSITCDNAHDIQNSLKIYQAEEGALLVSGRCMGHILQLIINKVIENLVEMSKATKNKDFYETIMLIIAKCKDLTTSFNHSSQLTERLILPKAT